MPSRDGGIFNQVRFVAGLFVGPMVPYSPTNTVVATLDDTHPPGLGAQVADLPMRGSQYTHERNTFAPGPAGLKGQIDSFSTLDLGTRQRNPTLALGIAISVKNVLDRVYISDRLPNGIFSAGFRQILGTLSWAGG